MKLKRTKRSVQVFWATLYVYNTVYCVLTGCNSLSRCTIKEQLRNRQVLHARAQS